MSEASQQGPERIAVVGMACRVPGAESVDAFWTNLRDGVESIATFTDEELREGGADPAALRNPAFVRRFGYLEGADLLDADFFDLPPREAELMDPQHRLFLEEAWTALEHAGLDPDSYPGPVGVFAGCNMNTYLLNLVARHGSGGADLLQNRIRSDKDFLATLASYKLNLRGPSMSVQTACSTSLVAVHLACQSLLDYHCDAALAGGVSVSVPLRGGYLAREGVFSPDGHCRAFDARGEGTVGGSGVGVVVLKRLSDALADGDRVHAVILGSAVNNDGAAKVGYSAPSVEGQIEVVAMAHAVAGVSAGTVTLVEAHGTATPLGDPVEVAALTQAFNTDEHGFCALGSVKTNIGHLDAASGVASLIKAVLSLEHGEIPASLHFTEPNPRIDFAASPFFVADRRLPWNPPAGIPRRAGVSSFGVGGTNAHVVLEEAAPAPAAAPATEGGLELLVLSARTPEALERLSAATAEHLERHPELGLGDVAFTLRRGRRAFPVRRALVAGSAAEAASLLRGGDPAQVITQTASDSDPGVAFLFSGLGTQYAGMGRELYEGEPAFREAMDRCFAILRDGWGMDLRSVLYGAPGASGAVGSGVDFRALVRGGGGPSEGDPLQGARWGHPAMFAVGYALAETWRARGVLPRAVAGHSLGEYVAACVAGVFSLKDALKLVVRRAELLEPIPGHMAAVALSEDETRLLLEELARDGHSLWLAAVNAPRSCVVSGSAAAVAAFGERARSRGALVLPLAVRHPFHSGLLAPAREELARVVASLRRSAPEIPLAGNVTGEWLRAEQARSVEYWTDHLVSPVRFARSVDTLRGIAARAADEPVLLEVGPGSVLGAWARQQGAQRVAASLRHGEQPGSDLALLRRVVGQLWSWGVPVDWAKQEADRGRRRVVLPGHPLDRRRFWLGDGPAAASARPAAEAGPDAEERRPMAEWLYAPLWRQTPDAAPSASAFAGRRVAIFGGADAAPLADRLRAAGAETVRVEAGDGFHDGGSRFTVRPGSREDHDSLASALRSRGWYGATLTLHLASLDEPAAEVTSDTVDAALRRGVFSLLPWLQSASDAGLLGAGGAVLGATRGAQAVTGAEELRPWQATLSGLLKTVAQEYPRVRSRCVDVEARGWEDAVLREAARLLAEAEGPADAAYRGRRRWEPFFGALPATKPPAVPAVPLRERGVYLITGGLGGIGLAIARHLAERHQARLVLTGRRGLPPRGEWDARVAGEGGADETGRRILGVRELGSLGAEVLVLAADAVDAARMREVVAEARERFGALHGVVHAAGVVPGGLLQLKTEERLAEVLAPKVRGTLALDEALAGVPVDFVLLCSSLHALYGGIGAADHTAANAFLDAFAHWRSAAGHPVIAVNWDGWTEVGQAAAMAVSRRVGGLFARQAAARVGHPLLAERTEREGGWDYAAELGAATHWVLDEHRVGGVGTLPGTAYLEMVRAAFADRAPGAVPELEQVVFLAPLFVQDGETREVRLRLEEDGGGFAFRVSSGGEDGAPAQEHARGRVRAAADAARGRVAVEEVRSRLAPVELPDAAGRATDGAVRFGPRWTGALRAVWRGEAELLAELEVPAEFAADLDAYALHPALLDAATGFMRSLGRDLFLPLAYERVTVLGPLPARFYSHVRHPEVGDGETLACDVVILDESGEERVRIEGYTLRRVADSGALGAAPARRPAPAALTVRPLRASPAGISPGEGAEIFARVLEHGLGPQVAVCTRDLPAMIRRARRFTQEEVAAALHGGADGSMHSRPAHAVPYVEPRSELERTLTGLFSRVLGIDRIGVDDSFFEMGGDSLLAVQLLASVKETFGVELPLRALFEAITPTQLAVAIVQRQAELVEDDLLLQALAEL